jgi:hypothetical protein
MKAKILSVHTGEGAKLNGTEDVSPSTAPDRNEQPLREVPILAISDSTPLGAGHKTRELSPCNDTAGAYECGLVVGEECIDSPTAAKGGA